MRESFVPVMQHALRRNGLPRLRRMLAEGSLLVDRGYVDPDALNGVCSDAEMAGRDPGGLIDASLYELLTLERGLRTLLT